MEARVSGYTDNDNYRSPVYCCMAKQKLELTFSNGFFIGMILSISLLSVVMDKYFVSKEVFKLKRIYVDGRIYKLCEDR